jgi:cell division protein FtsB
MIADRKHGSRRLIRLVPLALLVVFAFWFLSGPNGLVSIALRRHRARRLQAEIKRLKQDIEQKERQRAWLADPDSATLYARKLLGDRPDSTATPR